MKHLEGLEDLFELSLGVFLLLGQSGQQVGCWVCCGLCVDELGEGALQMFESMDAARSPMNRELWQDLLFKPSKALCVCVLVLLHKDLVCALKQMLEDTSERCGKQSTKGGPQRNTPRLRGRRLHPPQCPQKSQGNKRDRRK